jgi:hypothetical protein
MANRTVELITSKYGRLVFKNAASEATLRDLIDAVDDLEDSIGASNSGTATPAVRNISKKAKSINKEMSSISKFGKGIKQTGKTFVKLIETNADKASAWGEAVNDNLIKNVPVVGGFLGSLGDVVISTVKIFEGWNDVLKQTSKYGASFNNSVIALRFAAADSYLSLDTFSKLIMENSETLAGIGGTVTEGAFIFSKFNAELKREGSRVRDELMQMGLTTDDVSEQFMNYMSFTLRGVQKETVNYKKVTDQFVDYARLSMLVTQLSGQDAKKSAQQIKAVRDDAAFMAEVNNQHEKNRGKLLGVLELSAMINGNAGIKYAEASLKNQKGLSETANMMATLFPNNAKAIDEMMAIAKDTSIDQKEFNRRAAEIVAKYGGQLPAQFKNLGDIANKISIGSVGMENYKEVVYAALAFQNRMGGAAEMTEEKIRKKIEKALKEQARREALTEILNTFSQAIMTAHNAVLKVLGPELTKMAEELEKQKLGEKIRDFSAAIGPAMQEMWPKLKNFVAFLATPEGLEYAKDKVEEFVRSIWVRMKFWAVRKLLPDWMGWLGNITWNSESGMTGFGYKTETEQLKTIELAFKAGEHIQKELAAYLSSRGPARTFKPSTKLTGIMGDSPFAKWWNNLVDQQTAVEHFLSHDTEHKLGQTKTGTPWRELTVAPGTAIRAPFDGNIRKVQSGNEFYLANSDTKMMFGLKGLGEITNDKGELMNAPLFLGYRAGINTYVKAGQIIGYVGKGATPSVMMGNADTGVSADLNRIYNGFGYRTGTLGQTGNLFANFDPVKGTPALLHGKEAVVTVPQMGQIISSAGQISVAQFITSLNSNINVLISLAREENRVERNKLSAIKNMKLVRN